MLFSAVAASAVLHAAVLALVLLPAREEAAREINAEVTWVLSAAPSYPPSPPTADRERVSDFAEREIAAQEWPVQIARPHPEEPVVAPATIGVSKDEPPRATFARNREADDTVPSRQRRQAVASRAAHSRHAESPRTPSAPVPTAATAVEKAAAPEWDGGPASLARTRELESSPANSVAAESEIVYRVAPTYPVAARRRGIEGAVVLHVRFDAGGRPEEISVMTSSGSAMLDDAAREAVARWRFRGGAAGALELPITFRFADAGSGGASSIQ